MFEESIKFKNIGFVNYQWTEIVVEDDEKCDEIERETVKRVIIQMSQRESHNPRVNNTEKYIRVKHKTYVPVEVCKDRNSRMIYTPLKSVRKLAAERKYGLCNYPITRSNQMVLHRMTN